MMTKKKMKSAPRAQRERKPMPPLAVTPAPEAEPVEAKTEAPKKFTEFLWHGLTRFRCSSCGFDASSEAEIYRHYHTDHILSQPKPVLTEVDTGLVSPQGDKIVRIEEVENGKD